MNWWQWLVLAGCCVVSAVGGMYGTAYYISKVYR